MALFITIQPSNFRLIALTSCLGKPFHHIKADRMAQFMTKNDFINETTQKAFLKGVNGCIEHIQVLQEIMEDAKANNCSFYDLTDAYGSVLHKLIEFCLSHYHVPESKVYYIMSLYSKLRGKIMTQDWVTETFEFCRGIFAGDNYSPIIFNVVFQPLIDFIKKYKERQGYRLGNSKIITKPFGDDFEILSNHKGNHQKLQDIVQKNASTMGLTFKPSKCRALSICGGRPKPVEFFLTDLNTNERVTLKTLETDSHKFLGAVVTHHNTPQDRLKFLVDKLDKKLANLDKSRVRGEYKLAVYTRYVLPAMRYHLTVHSVHKTHLDQLDMVAQRYLKLWLGIPARGCTSLGVFSPSLLGVKPVSQVYLEGHFSAYFNSKLVANSDTKEALKCTKVREGQWTNKSSTTTQCKDLVDEMGTEQDCFIPTEQNTDTFEATLRVEMPKIKKAAKLKVAQLYRDKAEEDATKIPFQGAMLSLLAEEKEDISCQALIHQVPRGVLAWAVRAGTNTLATPDNLARWGVRVDTRCKVQDCGLPSNLGHLSNGCKKSLDRFRFRHDSVLAHLVDRIVSSKTATIEVYADLDGWRVNGGTVPSDLVATGQIPDIVLLDKVKKTIMLLELTCPFDSSQSSFNNALDRKTIRYCRLALDCKKLGYTAYNTPLEIRARGVITARNHAVLAMVTSMCRIRNLKTFRRTLGKIALVASYRINLARNSPD